jgi:hypothetical protein
VGLQNAFDVVNSKTAAKGCLKERRRERGKSAFFWKSPSETVRFYSESARQVFNSSAWNNFRYQRAQARECVLRLLDAHSKAVVAKVARFLNQFKCCVRFQSRKTMASALSQVSKALDMKPRLEKRAFQNIY